MENAPLYLGIAALAAVVALVGTRLVRRVAVAFNLADAPNERRINTTSMPRAGGFAVALSFSLVGATVTVLAAPLGLTGGTPLPTSGVAALLFGVLITVIGLLVILYARYYLSEDDPFGRFYGTLMLFMAAMLGIVLSDNLILTVVF